MVATTNHEERPLGAIGFIDNREDRLVNDVMVNLHAGPCPWIPFERQHSTPRTIRYDKQMTLIATSGTQHWTYLHVHMPAVSSTRSCRSKCKCFAPECTSIDRFECDQMREWLRSMETF